MLITVSVYARRDAFRQKLESISFDILEIIPSKKIGQSIDLLESAKSLVEFGSAIYEIEPMNAEEALRRIDRLNSAIRQFGNVESAILPVAALSKLPEKTGVMDSGKELVRDSIIRKEIDSLRQVSNPSPMADSRQSAIIDKVKQSSGSRVQLKDILSGFPGVSERTIRYDLQKLCNQGILERMGNGGPSSFYILKGI